MIEIIPFAELGAFKNEWLDSRFHFDFSGVAAPMGRSFGPLKVWNDDVIQPHTGFGLHGHRDMEIITYVRKGSISHEDSLGNKGRIPAGDIQVMSAGTGIRHAERNEDDETTELYQIWVEPDRLNLDPGWRQAMVPKALVQGHLKALVSGQPGIKGMLSIHQDATLYGGHLAKGREVVQPLGFGRRAYVVAASIAGQGRVLVNGKPMHARDGAAITDINAIKIRPEADAEILLFDLA